MRWNSSAEGPHRNAGGELPRGGEAWQVTDAEKGVGAYRWSPDGSRIAFTMADPDTEEEKTARKEKRDVILVDVGHVDQIDGLPGARRRGARPLVDGEQAPSALQVVEAAVESSSLLVDVFLELVTNALKAMDDGPVKRLRVSTRSEPDEAGTWVVVQIGDTGPGIPAALRDKIFDIFFTTKPVGMGAGLGLAIVKEIVHAHGDEVDADRVKNTGVDGDAQLGADDILRRMDRLLAHVEGLAGMDMQEHDLEALVFLLQVALEHVIHG